MPFPTTGVLDDFERADSPTLDDAAGGHHWTEGDLNAGTTLEIVSNAVRNLGAGNSTASARWDDETFGADSEAHMQVVKVSQSTGDRAGVAFRVQQPGSSTFDAYGVDIRKPGGAHQLMTVEWSNGSSTDLSARTNITWTDGDSIGGEAIGSTIKAYHDDGSWNEITDDTDPTISAAGYIGITNMERAGGTDLPTVKNFGGGTVVSAAVPDIIYPPLSTPIIAPPEVVAY